jgi:hypothetical protein
MPPTLGKYETEEASFTRTSNPRLWRVSTSRCASRPLRRPSSIPPDLRTSSSNSARLRNRIAGQCPHKLAIQAASVAAPPWRTETRLKSFLTLVTTQSRGLGKRDLNAADVIAANGNLTAGSHQDRFAAAHGQAAPSPSFCSVFDTSAAGGGALRKTSPHSYSCLITDHIIGFGSGLFGSERHRGLVSTRLKILADPVAIALR